MKKIKNYLPPKYQDKIYTEIEDNIFIVDNLYVTSLSFEVETDLGRIPQFPLEDVLDYYSVYINDFYNEVNSSFSQRKYLEFSSENLSNIKKLREVIGKNIYNKIYNTEIGMIEELIFEEE